MNTYSKYNSKGKVTGKEKKNVTRRNLVPFNPFYYAYNYYFRCDIKEITILFAYAYDGSVNKKMSPSGRERVTLSVFL